MFAGFHEALSGFEDFLDLAFAHCDAHVADLHILCGYVELKLLSSGQIEHAIQEQFSLTFTSETYASFQRRLALRRARLDRPTELLVALSHGHPFGPSAASSREPSKCPSCDHRDSCKLHSAHMSEEDRTFFRAVFGKQPYALGLIWGLDSRGNDVLKVYGSRLGCFRERSIRVVEEAGEEVHP